MTVYEYPVSNMPNHHSLLELSGELWLLPRRPPLLGNTFIVALVLFAVYACICRFLRFHRVKKLEKKYGECSLEKDAKVIRGRPDIHLSPQEMQEIIFTSLEYDMPSLMHYSLIFGLFKTYGIPTISELLVKTEELAGKDTVSRRVADTAILVKIWLHCPFFDARKMNIDDFDKVDSRCALAIARTNWLHSKYPQIKNEDSIYTISLAILEPARWAKRYGWRELLPIEQEAYFQYWRLIAERMNIQDMPETLEELCTWSDTYEETHMVPSQSSHKLGGHTITHLLRSVPNFFGLRDFIQEVAYSMLEDRVRVAMMFPRPPPIARKTAESALFFFRFVHGYLSLPRLSPSQLVPLDLPKDERNKSMPRMRPTEFEYEPWYKPVPKGLSLVIQNVLVNLGLKDPTYLPGPRFKSEGFRIEELGPKRLENNGHAEVMKIAEKLQGCPVTGPWARKNQ